MNIPRSEYPRPQFVREDWLCLNGKWQFEVDNSKSGKEREFYKRESLNGEILVPFCPESELSGIGNKDFMNCVWYRRNVDIPEQYIGKTTILHFGAVDYHSVIYVNGEMVGEHKGGYTSFSFDITKYLKENGNYITVCAYDDVRSQNQPAGKQSSEYHSHRCFYTRTTGIWQTVWLEFVNDVYVKKVKTSTNIDSPSVSFDVELNEYEKGLSISAQVFWEGNCVGEIESGISGKVTHISTELSEKHLWSVGEGNLYDVKFYLKRNGEVVDKADSYFGLRNVTLCGRSFKINGETVFGRWVLDQGFYPRGIYTAADEEELKADIIYSMQLGFNGARLHEKVFEERYLYWADKLGYLVWGEHANWGLDVTEIGQIEHFLPEWIEAVERDFNHPSIIGWCPFNETWDQNGRKQCDSLIKIVYETTKALDPTRPVIDTSGWFHVVTDIYDVHDYEQDPEIFASYYDKIEEGIVNETQKRLPSHADRQTYDGQTPVFMSEYGGIKWATDENNNGWGYGNGPKTEEEFIERYKGLTEFILNNKNVMGFCYTQLYDVEQEQNGLMTYERKFKFLPEIIRKINIQKAAIECENE